MLHYFWANCSARFDCDAGHFAAMGGDVEMCRWHRGPELAHRHILRMLHHRFEYERLFDQAVAQSDREFATPKDFVDRQMLNGGCGDRFKAAVRREILEPDHFASLTGLDSFIGDDRSRWQSRE